MEVADIKYRYKGHLKLLKWCTYSFLSLDLSCFWLSTVDLISLEVCHNLIFVKKIHAFGIYKNRFHENKILKPDTILSFSYSRSCVAYFSL
jgi:hypothetical protein